MTNNRTDVLTVAEELHSWLLRAQLSAMKVEQRPKFLFELLTSSIQNIADGGIWLTEPDREKVEKELCQLAELMFISIVDDRLATLNSDKNLSNQEVAWDSLTSQAFRAQDTISSIPLLPLEHAKTRARLPVDPLLDNTVFKQISAILFEKLAETWATAQDEDTARTFLEIVLKNLIGPFNGAATAALRKYDAHTSFGRVRMAMDMLESRLKYDWTSADKRHFRDATHSLAIRWTKMLTPPDIFLHVKMQEALGAGGISSPLGQKKLLETISALSKLEEHVRSFIRHSGYPEKDVSINIPNPARMEVEISVQLPFDRDDKKIPWAIGKLIHHLNTWPDRANGPMLAVVLRAGKDKQDVHYERAPTVLSDLAQS